MSLPLLVNFGLLQNRWKAILDPFIAIPMLKGLAISDVELIASTPLAIRTGLDRTQQGWFLIDNTASCTVWRTEPLNSTTLTLESSADTIISIWVF